MTNITNIPNLKDIIAGLEDLQNDLKIDRLHMDKEYEELMTEFEQLDNSIKTTTVDEFKAIIKPY